MIPKQFTWQRVVLYPSSQQHTSSAKRKTLDVLFSSCKSASLRGQVWIPPLRAPEKTSAATLRTVHQRKCFLTCREGDELSTGITVANIYYSFRTRTVGYEPLPRLCLPSLPAICGKAVCTVNNGFSEGLWAWGNPLGHNYLCVAV